MTHFDRPPFPSRALRAFALLSLAALAACGGSSGSGNQDLVAPSALSYENPQVFARGVPVDPLSPSVTGTVSSYNVSPALPAGVTLDTGNGQVSGIPTEASAEAVYTITAANSAGSTTFELTITVAGVDVLPERTARIAASGTSIHAVITIVPLNFELSGDVFSAASDPNGAFNESVDVEANGDGSYSLTFSTSATASPGHYAEPLSFALCMDAACNDRHIVPSFTADVQVDVLAPESDWLGDNLTNLVAWDGVPDWTTFQANAAHTGHVPVSVDPNQFSTRWRIPAVPLSSNFYERLSTLTASEGRLYIAGGNLLYARNEFDAGLTWEYDFSGLDYPSVNPPAVANGTVYLAAGQQSSTFMYAFEAANGALVFKSPMHSQWEHYLAPTVGEHGVYTNAGTYGGLFGFDPTGIELFFAGMDQTSTWTPAVDAAGVYTYTGGTLKVSDPVSGADLVSIFDPTFQNYIYEIGGSPVLGAPGSVIVANYLNSLLNGGDIGNTLTRFDTVAAEIVWQVPGVFPSTPAYADGVLYVANERPLRLEARSEEDGSLLWRWTPPASGDVGFDSEVLLTDNLAFVSTNLSTYAVDLATHRAVWSYPQVGRLALTKNGILYIQGDTWLTAINVK